MVRLNLYYSESLHKIMMVRYLPPRSNNVHNVNILVGVYYVESPEEADNAERSSECPYHVVMCLWSLLKKEKMFSRGIIARNSQKYSEMFRRASSTTRLIIQTEVERQRRRLSAKDGGWAPNVRHRRTTSDQKHAYFM